ncbi:hypothetical protein BDA96_02G378000 [Sorghum bicolor]|uniref:Uncharacterized protein n=2 Tax=Sorghum bicolor TaxID=4558 RepID=A0A921RTW1_SORBI|nr:peamaclein [Sorghum bicolor]EER97475.1 hypothetical protein SORBI_3002G360900 [Sorghum bicolor]KAG0545629.1 hypothetical protein BDA96_02G378000 [Sorghum bicolor]|eukprot:XP_002460954.1 peamaclein [Sorghum bicolor]
MRTIPAVLLLLILVAAAAASFQGLTVAADTSGAVPDGVCDGKCRSRCSLKKAGRCMGLCMMCCGKCQGCVPSGPYASKDECPCYRDMKSPKTQRPKCP